MRIAILGWGSLLWEDHPDFDRWRGAWQENDGPILEIEFSRISNTRSGALTLVIDETHGSSTQVAWCLSERAALEDAVCDLRCRERTLLRNIGSIEINKLGATPEDREKDDAITAWAHARKMDCVVWTALKSNFEQRTGKPFSVTAATAYLRSLPAEGKVKAAEYVSRAPSSVRTNLRSALEEEPWFGVDES